MALPVSKLAPELAFLPPLGDLFVMLQGDLFVMLQGDENSGSPGLFVNEVKVVREVRINLDSWLLIMW